MVIYGSIYGSIMLEPFKHLVITNEILNLISEIDEFKGSWRALGQLAPERLSVLRQIATIESIGSSTRIEGARLTDSEVEKLLNGLDIRSFRSRDEEEVAGYADAMQLIFESYSDIPLTENYIKQLHGILLKYSQKDDFHRGLYKKLNNHVEAFDANGKSLGIIFATATPFETPLMMEALVQWTQQNMADKKFHPLLIIAVFVLRFLAIHPFQDGNGRLSRMLTTLLLLRCGYAYVPYSSLERVIEENKTNYYRFLRRAQSTLDVDESNLNDWIVFFLNALIVQKNTLAHKVEKERLLAALPPISVELMKVVKEHGRITTSMAVTLIGANRNTIKHHLKHLVESGKLVQYGKGKGTWYSLT